MRDFCRNSLIPFGLLAMLVGGVGCSKKSKAWPDKPLETVKSKKGGVAFSISLPKGVGKFEDPAVTIWRSVSPGYAFFIKVFQEEMPDLKSLKAELATEKNRKVVTAKKVNDGVEVVIEEPSNKRYTVTIWKQKGAKVLKCEALLGQKIGGPEMVKKSNNWVLKICRSLSIL